MCNAGTSGFFPAVLFRRERVVACRGTGRKRGGQKSRGTGRERWAGRKKSDPRDLLKCDALSREGVVKTVPISPRRNKELRPVRDFSPSMLLYGALSLFRTNFPRCHALLSFVTSSLANPIGDYK